MRSWDPPAPAARLEGGGVPADDRGVGGQRGRDPGRGPDGGFITRSDFLMDAGVTASYWYGDLAEVRSRE